jgi:hypothetical protein
MALPSLGVSNPDDPPHPIELFRPSMDYQQFDAEVIRPFLLKTKARDTLGNNLRVSLTFAPHSSSFDEHRQFFSETDYNRFTPSKPFPPVPRADDISLKPLCLLHGYFSPKRPDYFIWEYGHFEQGSIVMLGGCGRLAKVLGVGGVGRNFFTMRLEDLEDPEVGVLSARKLIVSFNPVGIRFSILQRLKKRFFRPFLRSMRDLVDEDRVPEEVENSVVTELLDPNYLAVLESCFGALVEEASDILTGCEIGSSQVEDMA